MRTVKVVAAVIVDNKKVCVCQRKENDTFPLLWEFPGGSVEKKETLKEAIRREIKEELGVEIEPIRFLGKFEDILDSLKINVHLFLSRIKKGTPSAQECADFRFITLEELDRFPLAPVDKKIASYLKDQRHLLFST